MNIRLIAHTPNPEEVVATAAKLCYSNTDPDKLADDMTPEKAGKFCEMLAGLGHSTPTEMAVFTFSIGGISRSCMAQITRHRMASMNVRSQRYCDMSEAEMIIPPAIEQNKDCLEIYSDASATARSAYEKITRILANGYVIGGLDIHAAHKKAQEDARFVLPEGTATSMLLTMNARELNSFFALRCCNRAQWEIREVATEMLRLVYPIAPHLFKNAGPGCVQGKCSEGTMSCGMAEDVQKRFEELK